MAADQVAVGFFRHVHTAMVVTAGIVVCGAAAGSMLLLGRRGGLEETGGMHRAVGSVGPWVAGGRMAQTTTNSIEARR